MDKSGDNFEAIKHKDEIQIARRALENEERRTEHQERGLSATKLNIFVTAICSAIAAIGAATITGYFTFKLASENSQSALALQRENAKLQQELQSDQQKYGLIERLLEGEDHNLVLQEIEILREMGLLNSAEAKIVEAVEEKLNSNASLSARKNNFNTSQQGVDLLKRFIEPDLITRTRFNGEVYVGYNHRVLSPVLKLPNGAAIDVSDGMISQEEAEILLKHDLAMAEDAVNTNTRRSLTQSQFDALISFVSSVGVPAFETSNVLRLVNAGRIDQVPNELRKWVYVDHIFSAQFKERREAEIRHWSLTPG